MADAFLGVPQNYTLSNTPAGSNPGYIANDEPGLVYISTSLNVVAIDIDLDANPSVGAILTLGMLLPTHAIRYRAYTSIANRTAETFAYEALVNGSMSANRSAPDSKYLHVLPATRTERYWRIRYFFNTNQTTAGIMQIGRLLFLKKIQPPDNIEVGAATGIDDRSIRRYSRSGRRNIDPVNIYATFQGVWPWLDVSTFRADFRPLMLQRGATRPAAFVFDSDETTWGEDDIYYGDLEKTQSITYEDGFLFSYGFSIVNLWPSG